MKNEEYWNYTFLENCIIIKKRFLKTEKPKLRELRFFQFDTGQKNAIAHKPMRRSPMKKRILSLLLLMLLLAAEVVVAADPVYETTEEQWIAKGLHHKHILRLIEGGWQNINVITADFSEPTLQMKLLRSQDGVSSLETMMTHAQTADVDAAINGDFFAWRSGLSGHGSSIGLMVEEKELITSSDTTDNMASFGQDILGNLLIDYIRTTITLTAPNGDSEQIKHLNKYDSLDGIVMYTRDFQEESFGSKDNIMEFVIERDKVVEIRQDMDPVIIPENGYVLTFLPEFNNFIPEHFQVGDEVKIEVTLTPDRKLETAIGGGTMLITGGIAAKNTHNISGNNPRTAVGIDRTGKKLLMVTVDGRSQKSAGMTLSALRELMFELGAYDAINLDGGGSTRMIVRDNQDRTLKTVNQPTENRAVINGIGVKSASKATGILGELFLEPEPKVFQGTSIKMPIRAEDTAYYPMDINEKDIQFSASGVIGEWKGEEFYPKNSGTLKVTAALGKVKSTCNIEVLEKPVKLVVECYTKDGVKGELMNVWVKGIDRDGKVAMIPNRFVTFSSDKVRQEGDQVIALQNGPIQLQATYQGLKSESGELFLEEDEQYHRPVPEGKGTYLDIFGPRATGKKMIHLILENRVSSNVTKDGRSSIMMTVTDTLKKKVPAEELSGYQKREQKDTTIIQVGNPKGSIVAEEYSRFGKLIADLKAVSTQNVILVLHKGLDQFTSEPEKTALEQVLGEYVVQKGKKVFIVSGGEKDTVKIQNGIRHISIGKMEGDSFPQLVNSILNGTYLRFYMTDKELCYEFVKYK